MPSQSPPEYIAALVASVVEPCPANMRALLDAAQLTGVGTYYATRHRQGLTAAMDRPDDAQLARAAQGEQDAGDALKAARDAFGEAQAAVDQAEADAVDAKQRHIEQRTARMTADRALEDKIVAAAFQVLQPQKTS